jgi:hypothetical protein
MWYTLKDFHPPKIVPRKTMNAHLYGLKLMPNSLHLKKKNSKFFKVCGQVTKHHKIIKKYFHEHINVFTKSFNDNLLINKWFIFYTKWYYNPYKSDFVVIFKCYRYLMVSWKSIQECIYFMSSHNVDDLVHKG